MTEAGLLALFPTGSVRDANGTLTVGGCGLDAVADEFGTPAMAVAEDVLRQRPVTI